MQIWTKILFHLIKQHCINHFGREKKKDWPKIRKIIWLDTFVIHPVSFKKREEAAANLISGSLKVYTTGQVNFRPYWGAVTCCHLTRKYVILFIWHWISRIVEHWNSDCESRANYQNETRMCRRRFTPFESKRQVVITLGGGALQGFNWCACFFKENPLCTLAN